MAAADTAREMSVTGAVVIPVMRIVATGVMSDPPIVLMNVRHAGMTSLVTVIAVRAGIVPLSGIAAMVSRVAGLSLIVAIRIRASVSAT